MKITIDKIKSGQSFDDYIISPDNKVLNILFEDCSIEQLIGNTPVVLIGDENCGKSHLLNAMHIFYGNLLSEDRIVHIDCVELMNDIMESITQDSNIIEEYKKVDILLIDDLHLLWGKEKLQEVAYKIIDEFNKDNKIVVITIDKSVGYDEAMEGFKNLLDNGLSIVIKPLVGLYLFKLNKKLKKKYERAKY